MKYTVITGASSGIGYETALAFAARGKNLIIAARRTEELEKLKSKVADINADLDVVIRIVDLSVTANVYEFYESLQDYQIETWINNAGFGNFASVGEQNLNKIETMLHLNIEALTVLSSLYVRDYGDVDGTQIINISSGGGYRIVADAVTYCATKFYVSAFTEGLAQELKGKDDHASKSLGSSLQQRPNLRNAPIMLIILNMMVLFLSSIQLNKWPVSY